MPDAAPGGSRRNLRGTGGGVSSATARRENACPGTENMMERVVERENMRRAYRRVVGNRGSVGVDEMRVEELKPYLQEHWGRIKEELLEGRYEPQPVLRVEIPKPGGKGMRKLGIPTVVDRLIQQAMHQVLSPLFDPDFSETSYGFRPGRRAQQAIAKAREYVAEGKRWVVDIDLEKFFDRVNHDVLMSRVARKVKDKRVLRLIRRYFSLRKERRKGGHFLRCCRTLFWMIWTRNWIDGGTVTAAMQMTATSMLGRSEREKG
jgi:RNA-directed DNA polymerase